MSKILDLIYAGEYKKEMMADFEKRWDVSIEDASDSIHKGRFEVIFEADEDDYLKWLFETGIFEFSFHAQMARIEKPKRYLAIMKQVVKAQDDARS